MSEKQKKPLKISEFRRGDGTGSVAFTPHCVTRYPGYASPINFSILIKVIFCQKTKKSAKNLQTLLVGVARQALRPSRRMA